MKRFTYTGLALCFVLVLGFSGCSEDEPSAPMGENGTSGSLSKTTDHYLVEYANESQMSNSVAKVGGVVVDIMDPIKVAVVTGLSDDAANKLETLQGIQFVTRDAVTKWVPTYQEAIIGAQQNFSNPSASGNPMDAGLLALQWGLQAINAPAAWNVTTGSSEIRVGILDTGGSPEHVDLAGKYDLSKCINFSISNPTDPSDWQDRHFHGTHVAGTISTNNIGVAGVAPDVTLVAIKVLGDNGSGSFESILRGIIYAADDADCDIINMSLGGTGSRKASGRFLSLVYRAMNYAKSKGVLVVCSAGNSAMDLDHNKNLVVIPAEAGSGMVVSATGPLNQQNFDTFACYSNYGNSAISVAAPGGNIDCVNRRYLTPLDGVLSCLAPYRSGTNNAYAFAAGTSMAAPHVAGVAALVLDAKGKSNPGYVKTRLQNTADDLGAPGNDPYYGKGRINAAAAVQ